MYPAHIVETASTRTTRLLAGVVFLFWATERISIPFSPRSSVPLFHFPRVIASLFYELLNGACWITSRRGRISRSSNKIIRLSRNYTSLSLSGPIFRLSIFFDRFKTFQPTLVRYCPFSPSFISSMYYFFNVLFHQACIVIRFVVYFGSRVMTTARRIFSSLPNCTPVCTKITICKESNYNSKIFTSVFPAEEREGRTHFREDFAEKWF